ncbi:MULTISPECIES: hypothetical protein [unclassified Sphingobium]|uniref:hypothetical protein n=1 Tax=unclassified Sphingobium TaxID=2611147 RepID=UPI002225562D|nr:MULTISPECIES: hypothetical protein [unclassified Sphingobium]MCW2412955.1 hypothetical protein [Sphingobium sp. B8D3D]MCW2414747.1 hypothetical protein [Sphingobium sp. B8D3A]
MIEPIISRFASASRDATADLIFSAPIAAAVGEHSFGDVLQALADHESESGQSHYFSFSKWNGGHSDDAHDGASCIALEYTKRSSSHVRAILMEAEWAFYTFPTKAKRRDTVMFVLPLDEHLNGVEAIRSNCIVAALLSVRGLVPACHMHTYLFRFAPGAIVEFMEGTQFGRNLLEEFCSRAVDIRELQA